MNIREQFEKETGIVDYPPVDYPSDELVKSYAWEYLKEFNKWLESKLTKKDAEIERLHKFHSKETAKVGLKNFKLISELQSLRSKMDKAQKVWVIEFEDNEMDNTYYDSEEDARNIILPECRELVKYHQVLLMEVEVSDE